MKIFLCYKKADCIQISGDEHLLGEKEKFIELRKEEWKQLLKIIKK